MRRLLPWLWVSLSLLSFTTFAQGFELDLTDEAAKVPAEFKPSLAVLSVLPADGDEVSLGRARQLEAELLKHLAQSDQFKAVIEPRQATLLLGPTAETAARCLDYACFDAAAKALKVNRVVRLTVQRSGPGSLVTVYGNDPGFNEVLTFEQDSAEKAEKAFLGVGGRSQAQKDRDFLRKISTFFKASLAKLASANGKLEIDNVSSTFPVLVDGALAGTGTFDVILQRGQHTVRVDVDGYLPFEQSVSVEALQTVPVKISLRAKAIEPTAPQPSSGPPVYARPGLYVAVAGALAVAAGVALGQSAVTVNKALASDANPLPITRTTAKAGVTQALLANILVAVGAAAVVGGTTWVVVTPSFASDQKPGSEPTETPAINGAVVEFGARF